ncbi:MAG: hypothetical protein RL757_1084 [Bacteroidota bacterium]|jgi:RNA polymerase sigma-70 factor (ECF subfamily)
MKQANVTVLTDFELIERILKRNDAGACRLLVQKHQDYAFTIAFRVLNNRQDAEDAAQEAFINAFRALPNFERNAKFTTWFYRIALNAAFAVKAKRKPDYDDIETQNGQVSDLHAGEKGKVLEQKKYLKRAIAQLSEEDAAVVTLFYLNEQSLEETAQIMGIEIGNIKVKLHRARKKLATLLQNWLGEEAKNLIG